MVQRIDTVNEKRKKRAENCIENIGNVSVKCCDNENGREKGSKSA